MQRLLLHNRHIILIFGATIVLIPPPSTTTRCAPRRFLPPLSPPSSLSLSPSALRPFGRLPQAVDRPRITRPSRRPVQIEKNTDEIDYGILKTCLKDKDCIEDITSSLGGRCVASEMSSESIRSPSHESIKIQNGASFVSTPCQFANGTAGIKCVGENACSGSDIATIGCGSCIGYYACRNMYDNNIIAENSCLGEYACFDMGVNNTISENSCLGGYACAFTNDNSTIGKNSCIGSNACKETEGKSLPR